MKTYDYYGWEVVDEDILYTKLLEKDINITDEDQQALSKIIDQYINPRRTALDVGCHYGFLTKFLSQQFENVHAFDFDNDIFACFRKNIDTHSITNCTVHPYGLGEREKQVATNDWFTRHQRRGPLGNHIDPNGTSKKYLIKNLDSLGIKDVDLMMVDTEGYELMVLQGAVHTIEMYKPVLVLEFHNRRLTDKFGYTLNDLEKYVSDLGYRSIGYLNKVDKVFVPKEKIK